MKCPYIQKEVTFEETANEFNDSQCCVGGTTKTIKNIKLPDCLKENCGAWQNGHCNFKGND